MTLILRIESYVSLALFMLFEAGVYNLLLSSRVSEVGKYSRFVTSGGRTKVAFHKNYPN